MIRRVSLSAATVAVVVLGVTVAHASSGKSSAVSAKPDTTKVRFAFKQLSHTVVYSIVKGKKRATGFLQVTTRGAGSATVPVPGTTPVNSTSATGSILFTQSLFSPKDVLVLEEDKLLLRVGRATYFPALNSLALDVVVAESGDHKHCPIGSTGRVIVGDNPPQPDAVELDVCGVREVFRSGVKQALVVTSVKADCRGSNTAELTLAADGNRVDTVNVGNAATLTADKTGTFPSCLGPTTLRILGTQTQGGSGHVTYTCASTPCSQQVSQSAAGTWSYEAILYSKNGNELAGSRQVSVTWARSLTDGSFEDPVVQPGSYQTFPSGSTFGGWMVVGGGNVAIISGSFTSHGFTFPAQDGSQWLDLTGALSNSTEGVEQQVDTQPGAKYTLDFYVGNVVDNGGTYGTSSTVNVFIDGNQVMSAQNSDGAGSTTQVWKEFMTSFTATSTTTTIEFINGDPSNDNTNGLDNVTLTRQ